eukprot:jgi/Chrzof1/1063/Cz01g38280.t1
MSDIQKGDHVAWNWGSSHAEGTVSEKSTEKLTIESKGKQVTRNGTEDNPAFKIENPGKNPVVKKASELHKLEDGEEVPSKTHVQTRRQEEMKE